VQCELLSFTPPQWDLDTADDFIEKHSSSLVAVGEGSCRLGFLEARRFFRSSSPFLI
jgi:hypothetical protein